MISGGEPVFSRGHAQLLFESGTEDAFGGKSGVEADTFYGQPGVFQQIFGGGDPYMEDIFMGGEAGFPLEGANEMKLAQSGQSGQLCHGEFLREMFVDIGDNVFCHAGMIADSALRGRMEQKGSENIREVLGDQRFPDGAAGGEDIPETAELAGGERRIR